MTTTATHRILVLVTILFVATALPPAARASEPIILIDSMALSPDGRDLVISWRGDLWTASATGGTVRRLTSHSASDRDPEYSPDGERIAFISDRTGSRQLHVVAAGGGIPEAITRHTEGFGLEGWFPDGESFLVSATRDHFWRHAERFFRQYPDPSRKPDLMSDGYGRDGSLSPDGKKLLFTREGTRSWRKRYHGSQASQIWLFDLDTSEFRRITEHDHGERHPRWLPGGESFLYTSQESGTFNLWRRDLATGEATQLTFFEDDGAYSPAVSRDGSTVVFRRLVDVYRLEPGSNELPRKLELRYDGDPWIDPMIRSTLTTATAAAFTDDAREIAFVAGGDIWVMDTELREPVQVTRTPEEEPDPVFSPDFDAIVFVSDSGGQTDLWRASRDDDRYWWQQKEFKLDRLTQDPQPEQSPRFTPDGRIAFHRLRGDQL